MSDGAEQGPYLIPPKPFRWEHIDHSLARLKLLDLSIEMNKLMEADERRIQFENRGNMNSGAVPTLVLKMKQERADEWAHRVYEIYCGVWNSQGYAKSGPFVRAVCARAIIPTLGARTGAIASQFSMFAARTSFSGTIRNAHLQSLQLNMQRLQDRWRRQLEVEAKECEHAERRSRQVALTSSGSLTTTQEQVSSPRQVENRSVDESRREAIVNVVRDPKGRLVLSTLQTAQYFEITPRTVYRWLDQRKLKNGGKRGAVTIESIKLLEKKRARRRRSL